MMPEEIARQLDADPDYRVLRRLKPREVYAEAGPEDRVFRGLLIDTETTGLDTTAAKVIELGMVPFDYTGDGRVLRVHLDRVFSSFNDPGEPISPDVTALTGITDDMVAGQAIDSEAVRTMVEERQLVIAHNAAYDRPIVERHWPVFEDKYWACSLNDIDWRGEGIGSAKLDYLAMTMGFFFEGHRAADDCLATVEILSRALPSGRTALSALIENARGTTIRIRAVNAAFEKKDDLKGRDYRWNDGSDGHPKAWWKDIPEADLEAELDWLGVEVYPGRDLRDRPLPMEKITARNRYRS